MKNSPRKGGSTQCATLRSLNGLNTKDLEIDGSGSVGDLPQKFVKAHWPRRKLVAA